MKDVHEVVKKMTRNAGKMAKLIGCAFRFETEFTTSSNHICITLNLKEQAVYLLILSFQFILKQENFEK